MKNRLVILGADFSANAILGKVETSYSLNVDITSVDVPRLSPVTIYARSELQTYNDDVLMGSVPAPISVSAIGGLIATVGAPEGNIYPITLDASAVTQEICEVTITQIGTSNSATVVANAQIYAIKRSTNAPLMDVVYAQGWSESPDYMTFDEAAAVTTFGTVFNGNTAITNGEDFQHFTGLTTWGSAWKNMSAMTKIKAAGKPTSAENALLGATSLVNIDISNADMSLCTRCTRMIDSSQVESLDLSSWKDSAALTQGWRPFTISKCKTLIIPEGFGHNCYWYYLNDFNAWESMEKVVGWFDGTKTPIGEFVNTGYPALNLRQFEFRNGGAVANSNSANFNAIPNWGVNSAEVPDARQSLKNTFDYLFDRASAGYAACTITLSTNTLNELIDIFGDDGMLAIINKGYTIANYTPAG